jgi:hypothetical protein
VMSNFHLLAPNEVNLYLAALSPHADA